MRPVVMPLLAALLFVLTAIICFSWAGPGDAPRPTRVGVVDVSAVFKNYKRIVCAQRYVDETFGPRHKDLERQGKELLALGERIRDARHRERGMSEALFDQVQRFQKRQFLYERRRQRLDAEFVARVRRDMRDVLNDIRAAINAVAEEKKLELVLRSADADNLKALESPGEDGERDGGADLSALDEHIQQILQPRSTAEVLGRFRRNPVLFGSDQVDITAEVTRTLNEKYME